MNKLDVAAQHITAGLQMIGCRANPYSTHLLAMAADEIIETYANKTDVLLEYGAKLRVKDEFQKQWFQKKRESYNFFKHSDRDHLDLYSGPDYETLQKLNDITFAFSITGLVQLNFDVPTYMTTFIYLFFCKYPEFCHWDKILQDKPELSGEYEAAIGNMDRKTYEGTVQYLLKSFGIAE